MSTNESPAVPPLKCAESPIDPDDPWGDDNLSRKQLAEVLSEFVLGETGPLVVALNGEWGTGKTFMLRRWREQLTQEGKRVVYFNAWEDDHLSDPIVAILGQLFEVLDREDDQHGVMGQLQSAAENCARMMLESKAKQLFGIDLTRVHSESREEKLIDEYRKEREARGVLSSSMTCMAENIHEKTGTPLVFIVDELDRCRPSFAIEVLERIKHLFAVPHVVFVLGIDRKQLLSSICSVYGEIDAEAYLRRFVDLEFVLPEPDYKCFCKAIIKKVKLEEFLTDMVAREGNTVVYDEHQEFLRWLPLFLKGMGLSLRESEEILRYLTLTLRNVESKHRLCPELTLILLLLKVKNPEMYSEYVFGDARGKEVLEYLEGIIGPDLQWELGGLWIAFLFVIYTGGYSGNEDYDDILQELNDLEAGKDGPECASLSAGTVSLTSDRRGKLIRALKEQAVPVFYRPTKELCGRIAGRIELMRV